MITVMETEQSGSFTYDLTHPVIRWKIVGNLPVEEAFKNFSKTIDEARELGLGWHIILDLTDTLTAPDASQMQQLTQMLSEKGKAISGHFLTIISDDLQLGLSRMFSSLSMSKDIKVTIKSSMEEALKFVSQVK